ncbi:hypothetical protein BHE74_00023589, partial [Ensete ventricosum]
VITLSFTLLSRRRHRCPYASGGIARCCRQSPCQGAATPAVNVVAPTGGSPLRVRHGQPLAGWPLATVPCGCAAGNRPCGLEIIYPCIPDSDGEDEGGQASSSLAVSTQWISVAKLLQSDLATLAQREGGE